MSDDLKRKITEQPLPAKFDDNSEAHDKCVLEKVMREQLEKAGSGARSIANAKVPAQFGQDFVDVQVRIPVSKGLTQEARQKIADALSVLVRQIVDDNLDQLRSLGAIN